MKITTKLWGIVTMVLIGVIVFLTLTKPVLPDMNDYIKIGSKEYILLSSKIDTIYKYEVVEIPDYKPYPVPGAEVIIEVPIDVDTTAILKDYFKKYYYEDTILIDSVGKATIKDTISTNRILSRSVIFDYKIPTFKETIIVKEKPRNIVYLGGGANINSSVYLGAMFDNKQTRLFGVNVGLAPVDGEIKPIIGASVYFKLKFKKD